MPTNSSLALQLAAGLHWLSAEPWSQQQPLGKTGCFNITRHASIQRAGVSTGSTASSITLLHTVCCRAWHASQRCGAGQTACSGPDEADLHQLVAMSVAAIRSTATGSQLAAQRTMAPADPASPCITPARICAATSDTPDGVCGRKMVLVRPFAPTSCTGDNSVQVSWGQHLGCTLALVARSGNLI